MLDDHEWFTLREVERRLLQEDPQFLQSFDARARRLHRRAGGGAEGAGIALLGAVVLAVVLAVAGSMGTALAIGAIAVLIWIVGKGKWPSSRR